MLNIHDLISGGLIGWPLTILAFIAVYLVFLRDTDTHHKPKHPHEK